jgi:phosphoserine aminotransferase
MISFYPGPSKIYGEIPLYVKDAHKKGILSMNHRSDEFIDLSETTIKLLKDKLNIPRNFTIFFTSSATECWEIIAQSLISDRVYHLYNGAFGQKWYDYTKRLKPLAMPLPFGLTDKLDPKKLLFDQHEGVICITQNETSNGTQVSNQIIKNIKKNNPNYVVAVDATSSLGGIKLDFRTADVWFASVQKCLGLPAGLGLLITSPQALERARIIGEKNHYNSLTFMMTMMEKWQTPFTPNVLSIYLLMRVLQKREDIGLIHERLEKNYVNWCDFIEKRKTLSHLVENEDVRSLSVIPVRAEQNTIQQVKKSAKRKGFLLGEGYGEWKPETFRIANFPALTTKEIKSLMDFLKPY